jgi:Fe-S cluster assembly protein SufD
VTVGSTSAPERGLSPAVIERVEAMARPTRRDEAWRYAPHRSLDRLVFGPDPAPGASPTPDDLDDGLPTVDGPRIVIVNGIVDRSRSTVDGAADGLLVAPLAVAAERYPDDVAAHVAAGLDDPADAFVALNAANGRDGAFVHVAEGTGSSTPVHIVHVTIPDQEGRTSSAGVVIRLDDAASATVVETHVGRGDVFGGSNARSTVILGRGASLDHIVLQDLPVTQVLLDRIDVRQGEASRYRAWAFNLGASYGRVAYDVRLDGEAARADLSGLYVGHGDQILDQQVTVVHAAGDCTSRQSYRGILDDRSTGVFSGGIDVRPGADGTDAEQANDNLLLSRGAEANTQPRLEILADDVACKHGATVGQLDDDALYYLRTRGIGADEARRLLIKGFADRTVDEVELDGVRTWITGRLGHHDG